MSSGTAREVSDSVIASFRPGQLLDERFRLIEAIGHGGFGEVFRAEELLPNGAAIRQVALKVLSPESDTAAWTGEAKLLASFSHPSLVTILAAGLLDVDRGHGEDKVPVPFVAMELLDGETLGAVQSRRGAIPWRRVLAWARDVAAALDVIHARGVVHLDLKPSNLFLTREGRIKVLDFGIARPAGAASSEAGAMLEGEEALGTAEFIAGRSGLTGAGMAPPGMLRSSRRGSVVGTPGFMAPEVIEERPATPAADAYALAACIVHLATGLLPHDVPPAPPKSADATARKAWWAEVRLATSTGRIRDLEEAGLPRGVAAMCKRLLALEPAAREIQPGGLRALCDAAWERPYGVPDPPYHGLGTYGPASEGMLFGRNDDVARLAREIHEEIILILQGVSGSGKSSLAMAGIVPELARMDAATGPDWRPLVVRPGVDPDAALARALESLEKGRNFSSIADVAAFATEQGIGVAFVFDQLEELVTQAVPEKRQRFIDFLAEAPSLPREAPVRVVGTLREDFTSGLLGIEPLGERLRDALRFVGPPTMAAARAIVAEPARLAGVRIEGLGEIASDIERELRAGEGRLPLCALALSAFWDTREDNVLSVDAWIKLGGVRAIFADLADGVYAGLDEPAQLEARTALLELSSEGRTKRSLGRSYLRSRARNAAALDRALDAFIAAKLLVEAGGSIEVAHEFLFSAWDQLENWLADAQASRRLAAALLEGARAWQDLDRPATRLPGDSEVALAGLVLAEGGLSGADADLVREWLGAQRRRSRRDRVRIAAIAAIALSVLLIALAAWGKTVSDAQALAERRKHEADVAAEEARARKLEAEDAQGTLAKKVNEAKEAEKHSAEHLKQVEESFDRSLRNAKSDIKKEQIRCRVLEMKDRIKAGGCPPGDPLCSSLDSGFSNSPPPP